MDNDQIIELMVKGLRSRPGEWLTFAYLSSIVAIPDCDASVIAALADFRPDLFAVVKDRKLKLRMKVVEDIAMTGARDWKVPPPPEKILEPGYSRHHGNSLGVENGCGCDSADSEVLRHIQGGSIPDEALVSSCCWRNICRVRGLNFNLVSAEEWTEICRRRGYIQQRENPRGF